MVSYAGAVLLTYLKHIRLSRALFIIRGSHHLIWYGNRNTSEVHSTYIYASSTFMQDKWKELKTNTFTIWE
jgi:hypothetical protein